MLRWLESRILWGSLLILGGVVSLLQNLGMITFGELYWALLLGLGGVFFVSIYANSGRVQLENAWALIPGLSLFSIAALLVLGVLAPPLGARWGSLLVLLGMGVSFFAVYLADRGSWWAVIPGGMLLSLAVAVGLSGWYPGLSVGGAFFLGLGLTFALLAVLPTPEGRQRWAGLPAGVLVLVGLMILAQFRAYLNLLWSLALVLIGSAIIWRTWASRE
jgi:hypothetical protein